MSFPLLRSLLPLALVVGTVLPSSAVSVHPIARVNVMGGQYFTGETDSSGLNADAYIVPVVAVNSRFHIIPIYLGSYRRVQSVYNFLGENTLIDKELEQMGVLRFSYALAPEWRVKPRAGYKYSWIKQSTDDTLTGGLFNNARLFGGSSIERLWGDHRVELGYDFSLTRFPNYQALDADPRLTTTGITASAGTNVLDYNSHETTLEWSRASADTPWTLQAAFTWLRQGFVDQKVLSQDASGFEQFHDSKRHDDIFNLAVSEMWKSPRGAWQIGVGQTIQHYTSNQNAFDATQLFANPYTYRHYNFVDAQLLPQITRQWKQGIWEAALSGQFGYRNYSHRRAQNSSGTYLHSRIWSTNRGGTLTGRYRIPPYKKLYVQMTASVITYQSNTRYEANYPYNYTTVHYLGGLGWEF